MRSLILIILCLQLEFTFGQANCNWIGTVTATNLPVCDSPDPWVLVFEDNFETNKIDQSRWLIPYQGVYRDFNFENSKQWNANTGSTPILPWGQNVFVSAGNLNLTAKKENPSISGTWITNWATNPPTEATATFDYSSGEIETQRKFGYGKFEIRCKLPSGKGLFPAFWLYGDPYKNEVDIFEFWNEPNCLGNYDANRNQRNAHFNVHNDYEQDGQSESCPTEEHGPCSVWSGPDYSSDFHTFTFIWDWYYLEWYIDGVLKRKETRYLDLYTGNNLDCTEVLSNMTVARLKSFPTDVPMKMILDLAIQSGSEAPDLNTVFPANFQIDYFRYYKKMPCVTDITYNSNSELNLSNEIFNVRLADDIVLQNSIQLNANVQLDLKAKSSIQFKPGFSSKNGSVFNAKIDQTLCKNVNKFGTNYSDEFNYQENYLSINKYEENVSSTAIKIFPNPCTEIINFEGLEINHFETKIFDVFGNLILEKELNSNCLDISKFERGIYFITIFDSNKNQIFTEKIYKE